MADNVAITAGAGTSVATDDVSGVHYPFVKLVDGTLDSTTKAMVRTTQASATDPGLVVHAIIDADNVGSAVVTDAATLTAGTSNLAQCTAQPFLYNGANWVRGGSTPFKLISAATTNATSVKASAGILTSFACSNVNASPRYAKVYDKGSAPTVGTDTPKFVFLIPGNTTGAGSNLPLPANGIAFANGIALALTSGAADTDTGAVSVNENIVNLSYL